MTVTSNLRGTSELHWRIGLSGPAFYQGTTDPTVTPPTPIEAAFIDGDVYVRQGTANEGIWLYEQGGWNRMPSGLAGGTYTGPITHNGDLTANANVTLGNASPADIITINGSARFPNALDTANAIVIGADTNLYRSAANQLRTDTQFSVGTNLSVGGRAFFAGGGGPGTPQVTFTPDQDTGFYLVGADTLGITAGGVQAIEIIETAGNTETIIRGDLTVQGTTTEVNSTNLEITDNTILVNDGEAGAGVALGSAGIEVDRGTLNNVSWLWDEANDRWYPEGDLADQNVFIGNDLTVDGTTTFNSTGPTTFNGPGLFPDGTVGAPSISFIVDTNTGFYRSGADTIDTATAGVSRFRIDGTGDIITGSALNDFGAQFNLTSDTNDYMAISDNATATLRIGNGGVADIQFRTDSGQGLNLMPGGTERLRIENLANGVVASTNIVPSADLTYTLGQPALRWTVMYGEATSARYADLAERYDGPQMGVGTVVSIIDHPEYEIGPSSRDLNQAVLGVVSVKPAIRMNDGEENQDWPFVALRGRVPVRVRGVVRPGDLLVATDSGQARRGTFEETRNHPHAVFAKALRHGKDGLVEAVIL